jgi:hypothetical protein
VRARVVAEELRLDPAEDAPVQELVVHVQEILVQERVVAADGAGERHGLVLGGIEFRQLGQRCRGRLLRVAWEDEHQAVSFPDRIGADTARRPAGALGQIRYLGDAAIPAIGPGVIATAERVAFHDAHAQRYLAVGTPVLQGIDNPPAIAGYLRGQAPVSLRYVSANPWAAFHPNPACPGQPYVKTSLTCRNA